MTKRAELPDGLPDTFATASARASGVSSGRLRASDLDTPFSGTRARRSPADLDVHARQAKELWERCRAYLVIGPPEFAFSHVTAARLYGMPIPDRVIRSDVDVLAPDRAVRRRGVRGHSGRVIPRTFGGLPLVEPEVAWLQIAEYLTVDELVVAGDFLVRRKRPLATIELLQDALAAGSGRRFVSRASRALIDIRPGTDSPRETELRMLLVRAGLPEPVVGFEVHDNGYWVGTPDLARSPFSKTTSTGLSVSLLPIG